jgi:glycerophosphoryl diester phosphodiesterase
VRHRLLVALGGLALGATTVTGVALARLPAPPAADQVLVIGHRGAPRRAPENTLASVDAAHRLGVRWVENDVQRTRDGRLVVLHDATLRRTTDAATVYPRRAPWRLTDFTLAEVERLDAGGWFAPRFAGERVPTLDAYLRRVDRDHQGLLLELKNPRDHPGLAADVAARLAADGWTDPGHLRDRLVVQSFDAAALRAFHRRCPAARTALLGTPPVRRLPDYARFVDAVAPDAGRLPAGYLTAAHAVRGDHGRPLRVYPWTVDDPARAVALVRAGADGVITDRPDVVRAALATAPAGSRTTTPGGAR